MGIFERFKLHYSRNRSAAHIHFAALTALDYDPIADGIYVGTNQCCTTGLSDVLKKEGIRCDVSLEEERLDQPFGVEIYAWIPVRDHGAPTLGQLGFGICVLEKLVAEGKKVYVHCKNGHGRSSTLVSAYLMRSRGLGPNEAFALVRAKRPGAHMQEPQYDLLRAYERELGQGSMGKTAPVPDPRT